MQTSVPEQIPIQRTEHPYIVCMDGVCGGRPIIKDSRISVRHVAQLYKAGDTVDEILHAHPELPAAAVYDAISYYLDHQTEIEQEIEGNRLETFMQQGKLEIDHQGRLHFPGDS